MDKNILLDTLNSVLVELNDTKKGAICYLIMKYSSDTEHMDYLLDTVGKMINPYGTINSYVGNYIGSSYKLHSDNRLFNKIRIILIKNIIVYIKNDILLDNLNLNDLIDLVRTNN